MVNIWPRTQFGANPAHLACFLYDLGMEACLIILVTTCLGVIYIHYYSKSVMNKIVKRNNLLSEIFMVLDQMAEIRSKYVIGRVPCDRQKIKKEMETWDNLNHKRAELIEEYKRLYHKKDKTNGHTDS